MLLIVLALSWDSEQEDPSCEGFMGFGLLVDFRVPPSEWGVEMRRHRIERRGIRAGFGVEIGQLTSDDVTFEFRKLKLLFGYKGMMLKLVTTCGAL
jgi:hypothetical protein